MIEVEVTTRGLEFDEVASKFNKELKQKLIEKLADIAYASAFFRVPWSTGNLAQSIVKQIGEGEASIQALAPYVPYVIFGTAPHEIRPRNASCLVFKAHSGELVFTQLVRHPGTKPNPFMQKAVEDARSKVEETFAELWGELID